jgi:hypothetical protein
MKVLQWLESSLTTLTQYVLPHLTRLDVWTFIVALLALVATVWYGRGQLRLARRESETAREEAAKNLQNQEQQLTLAREEASRRPVLTVAAMGLENAFNVRQVREALESGYRGVVPDKVLAITLTNTGKDAALEISGRLYIQHPLYPFHFPGFDFDDIKIHQVASGLHIVTVNAPPGFKLRREANFDRLGFAIALKVQTQESLKISMEPIKYIFTPLQGESVEGTWHPNASSQRNGT